MAFYLTPVRPDQIYHHGILGQKWGVRRFQNKDGTLTSAGRQRYDSENKKKTAYQKLHERAANNVQKDADNLRKHGYKTEADAVQKVADKHREKAENGLSDKQKKAIKIGAAATATALAAVGTAYLVNSGKASAAVKAGKKAVKQVSKKTLSKGKKAVDKVVSYDERISKNVSKVFENTAKGKIKAMTDEQLKEAIKRVSSEKALYKQQHPFRADIADIMNKTAKTALAGASAYAIGSVVDKRLDKNQLGDYMRRGGAKKK